MSLTLNIVLAIALFAVTLYATLVTIAPCPAPP